MYYLVECQHSVRPSLSPHLRATHHPRRRALCKQSFLGPPSVLLTCLIRQRNIVIDDDGNPLLCDFGLSRIQHEVTRTFTSVVAGGKYRFIAPELYSGANQEFRTSRASDCYAFAMTILEMATLQHPFAEFDNELSACRAAERGQRPHRPEDMGDLPSEAANTLWALLGDMWVHNPEERPGLDIVETRLESVLSMLVTSSAD